MRDTALGMGWCWTACACSYTPQWLLQVLNDPGRGKGIFRGKIEACIAHMHDPTQGVFLKLSLLYLKAYLFRSTNLLDHLLKILLVNS